MKDKYLRSLSATAMPSDELIEKTLAKARMEKVNAMRLKRRMYGLTAAAACLLIAILALLPRLTPDPGIAPAAFGLTGADNNMQSLTIDELYKNERFGLYIPRDILAGAPFNKAELMQAGGSASLYVSFYGGDATVNITASSYSGEQGVIKAGDLSGRELRELITENLSGEHGVHKYALSFWLLYPDDALIGYNITADDMAGVYDMIISADYYE